MLQVTRPPWLFPSGIPSEPAASAIVVDSGEVIDYDQRYAETVLGKRQINWGNLIVRALIAFVAVGGGFVYWNERRLRGLPLVPRHRKPSALQAQRISIQMEGYPSEVSALLPKIAQLNPIGLHALKRLLENPKEASELLHSLSRLDSDLVRRVHRLDPGCQEPWCWRFPETDQDLPRDEYPCSLCGSVVRYAHPTGCLVAESPEASGVPLGKPPQRAYPRVPALLIRENPVTVHYGLRKPNGVETKQMTNNHCSIYPIWEPAWEQGPALICAASARRGPSPRLASPNVENVLRLERHNRITGAGGPCVDLRGCTGRSLWKYTSESIGVNRNMMWFL